MRQIKRWLTSWLLDEETVKQMAKPKQVTINIARLVDHITVNPPATIGAEQIKSEIEKVLKDVVNDVNFR